MNAWAEISCLGVIDLDTPKELNETDTGVPHVVFPFKDNSVQDGARNK